MRSFRSDSVNGQLAILHQSRIWPVPARNGKVEPKESESARGLEVSHLRKTYDNLVAVDDLSFHVQPGEVLGLIGPNGAGKSTSMMMIVGLLKPDAGTIQFNGRRLDPHNAESRALIGIVPQELAIYPQLTAVQNLEFFGRLYGLQGRRLSERVDKVLRLTGLSSHASQTPMTFSGGMQRRLNFGVALVHQPQLVVLDEPTVGVDPQSRTNLLDGVRALRDSGCSVVYASHYMEEIEAICDRVAIVDHGRLLRQGTLGELLDHAYFDLCVTTGRLPPEVKSKLAATATLREAPDGTTCILTRESREAISGFWPTRLRSVFDLLQSANVPLLKIESLETSLETLFLRLTGRKLRD